MSFPSEAGATGARLTWNLRGNAMLTDRRSRRPQPVVLGACAIILLLAAGLACTDHATVSEMRAHPERHVGERVVVHGVVTRSWKLPLLPNRAYEVSDGTGAITVVTDAEPPVTGADVVVRGQLVTAASLGSTVVGLHVNEAGRTLRRR